MSARASCNVARAAVLLAVASSAHAQCGAALGAGVRTVSSPRYDVAFRADPAPVRVSQHFTLDIVVCPKAGAPVPSGLDVDAHMPAHRHGMNYRPSVTTVSPGRYRAEGLLFHMSGEWEYRFDLAVANGRERITALQALPP